jgi:two-component system, OmpR family, sensor kinase
VSPTRSEIEKMLADRLEFLIGVGHDMRAPLTGIAGFAAVLAELESVAADPTASEAAAYIRKEAQRLVEMLNQLLDFGQVEQGGPDLDREPIDLVRMARQAVEPWALRYPHVMFRLVDHGDAIVEGDFLKLHRVLANLLDNAVRHSPDDGTITVEVGGDGFEAFLSVTDEGAGVPVADRERVFQRFVRLVSPTELSEEEKRGSGIGLYVVRGLVEAHGGSVSVDDSPVMEGQIESGTGARFVVKLPIRREVVPDHEEQGLASGAGRGEHEAVGGKSASTEGFQ